ncbi:GNAT family N-acetyltransferase [Natronosporangium hydrolyticum]|uniref:GNAT family N-acetyltransferase n=1 Tax=Natronosporangium hydrolyticum TaxID=2811111 RepID=A0A895YIZ1_9ACTN|nr:GNAT family N-acetyltransferase [Natronosporangium hydrolyticum]QSB16002.1 GNAT family N-acetyltransferase [Natronosporangium hydrolyticum]
MTELPIRECTTDDIPAVHQLLQEVFLSPDPTDARREIYRANYEPERCLVVTDEGAVIGHTGTFTRQLSVPGAVLAAAHVSQVGVRHTHRRQGVMSRLLREQLAQLPEPIAVLWASEGPIYPRFGYAPATDQVSLTIRSREVRLPEPSEPGRVANGTSADLLPELVGIYDAVRPHRPGWSSRDEAWWRRIVFDPPEERHGATPLKTTVYRDPSGAATGYALWRATPGWGQTGPDGTVTVKEVVATTPAAHLALWRFLLSIDLTRTVQLRLTGPSEPLLRLADAPNQLGAVLGAGLYLRIVDLPAALAGRRYATPVDLVIEVTDPIRAGNSGRWRLTGDTTGARCEPTTDPADLHSSIAALGAAYLGGVRVADLAGAGLLTGHTHGAVAAATAAFGWHRAPEGIEIF